MSQPLLPVEDGTVSSHKSPPPAVSGDDNLQQQNTDVDKSLSEFSEQNKDNFQNNPEVISIQSPQAAEADMSGGSTADIRNKDAEKRQEESEKHPRINKNDAMVYLEQVRSQFADQPEIYGKFLDIMKEFKAHTITTELVIERVTMLFRGYPQLIEGFNAFIPEEHRNRISSQHKKASISRASYGVHPPPSLRTGLTKYLSAGPSPSSAVASAEYERTAAASSTYIYPPSGYAPPHYGPPSHYYPSASQMGPPSLSGQGWSPATAPPTSTSNGAQIPPPYLHHHHQPHVHDKGASLYESGLSSKPTLYATESSSRSYHHPHQSAGLSHHHISSATPQLYPSSAASGTPTFSYGTPATVYPSSDKSVPYFPATEKGEREHKSSMGMLQAVGYLKKIQDRFYGHPEVYQSFVEILRSYQREQRSIRDVYTQVAALFSGHHDLLEEFSQFVPDAASLSKGGSATGMTRKAIAERVLSYTPSSSHEIRGSSGIRKGAMAPIHSGAPGPIQSSPSSLTTGKRGRIGPQLVSSAPRQPLPPDISTLPDGDFFMKVREFLGGAKGGPYGEFVKCLDLYTHRIVGKYELMQMVRPFLQRAPELLARFAQMLRIEHDHAEQKKQDEIEEENVRQVAERRLGSYRMLPVEAREVKCSGRTPLCHEVLNDEMVSCPSFNSEDSTFVASRKNAAEEALFRCEDERYELDLLIDGARSTLQWLEAERLRRNRQPMPAIYQSLIRRVWGTSAPMILKALQELSSVSIPLVTTRLLQKLEEWKTIFRQLNSTQWEDIHARNVIKALDYQGATIRTQDRKALSLRALTNEIQSVWVEQIRMAARWRISVRTLPSFDPGILRGQSLGEIPTAGNSEEAMQLECTFSVPAAARTLLALLLRSPAASENGAARRKAAVGQFLTMFLPQLFTKGSKRMYVNEALYHFFRLFQIAYCRIERLWELAGQIAARGTIRSTHPLAPLFRPFTSPIDTKTKIAAEDGAKEPSTEDVEKEQLLNTSLKVDAKLYVENASREAIFAAAMRLIEDATTGILDAAVFEERIRSMLGPSGYLFFTIDRLLALIHKQVITVLGDSTAERLISIFETDGGGDAHMAARVVDRFPLFLVEVVPLKGNGDHENSFEGIFPEGRRWVMRFGIIPEPVGFNEHPSLPQIDGMERWAMYVEQFVKPTYDHSLLKRPPPLLLRRTLRAVERKKREPIVSYHMELKIDVRTLQMHFVPGTEDVTLTPRALAVYKSL